LTELGLVDEYQLYLHPVVLGRGSHSSRAPDRRSALWPAN
jgi:riboflavin biosynthesis pyrimidine reductase